MPQLGDLHRHAVDKFQRYLDETREFLRQPGVSLTGEGVISSAKMLKDHLIKLGAGDTRLVEIDGGWPIVYGRLNSKGNPGMTLVMYGMNDVMPVVPEEWTRPPFAAEIVDAEEIGLAASFGKCVVNRGVYNQRGPLWSFLKAVETYLTVTGDVPCNIIFVIEHEEEMGSPSFLKFPSMYYEDLKDASGVFYARFTQDEDGSHPVYLGSRGNLAIELIVEGGDWGGPSVRDLHSRDEIWVDSPAWRLVWALNCIKSQADVVAITGFHDDVRPYTSEERKMLEEIRATFDEKTYRERLGVRRFKGGLPGADYLEEYLGPVVNIDGITAGYQGPKIQTIVPKRASAKIDIRLVPDMDPDDILRKLKKHLARHGFSDVKIEVVQSYTWYRLSPDHPIIQAMITASEYHGARTQLWPTKLTSDPGAVWTTPPLNLPLATGGLGYGKRAHSADEFMTVKGFQDCINFCITFLWEYTRNS